MSAYSTAIKLAEKNGISVPEFIKFLASPAGYAISKALDAIETQAQLPQGILSLAQNPQSAITDYVQTQAENAIYNQNEPSKIESIISELQGTNPDKPNYVGPQEVDSTLSQQNTAMLSPTLGVQPTGEFVPSNIMNNDIREALYGTITPNFPSFVGPQELNSPVDQINTQFFAEDFGAKPTQQMSSTDMINILNSSSNYGGGMEQADDFGKYDLGVSGFGGKGWETEIDFGDIGNNFVAYAKGGKIYIGKR